MAHSCHVGDHVYPIHIQYEIYLPWALWRHSNRIVTSDLILNAWFFLFNYIYVIYTNAVGKIKWYEMIWNDMKWYLVSKIHTWLGFASQGMTFTNLVSYRTQSLHNCVSYKTNTVKFIIIVCKNIYMNTIICVHTHINRLLLTCKKAA